MKVGRIIMRWQDLGGLPPLTILRSASGALLEVGHYPNGGVYLDTPMGIPLPVLDLPREVFPLTVRYLPSPGDVEPEETDPFVGLRVEVANKHAAMAIDPIGEMRRALTRIVNDLETWTPESGQVMTIRDSNGQPIGTWTIIEPDEPEEDQS